MSKYSGLEEGRKKKTVASKLSTKERAFVDYLLAGKLRGEAARLAGYAFPEERALKLMDPTKTPHVVAEIDRRKTKVESISDKKASDIQRILQVGAFMDPRPWFEPGSIEGGWWTISRENYLQLPLDIARHIKYCGAAM